MIEYAYLRKIVSRRIALFIIFLIYGVVNALAQAITGKIIDNNNRPIYGASIVLQTEDSTFVETTISNTDGSFYLSANGTPFILIVQHIDYNVLQKKYYTNNAGSITLTANRIQLDEVVVNADKPYIKTENGKLIYDIKMLTESRVVNNAWDIINKLPGVSSHGTSVSLIGTPKVSVLINGVLSTLSEEQLYSTLNNMPASRVSKAEIIYNAPPQYHVNGAIINLVTNWFHRKFNEVLSLKQYVEGEIGVNYTNQFFGSGGFDRSFRFAGPKLNFDFSFAANKIKKMKLAEVKSRHTLDQNVYNINQKEQENSKFWENDIRSSLSYKFNDKNNINIIYSGVLTPSVKRTSHSEGNFQNSFNNKRTKSSTHNMSLNTNLGIGLSLGVEYTKHTSVNDQNLITDYRNGTFGQLTATSGQALNRYAIYADQVHSIKKGWSLGYGASYTYTKDRNSLIYTMTEGIASSDDTNGKLEEYKTDFYLTTSKLFKGGLFLNASLKSEYYKIAKYKKWTLYPRVSLSYTKNPKHVYQLGLSSNNFYLAYWAMQRSISYKDGYSEIQGSPEIRPSSNYNVNATYIFNRKYTFGAFYSYTKDYFTQTPYQSATNLTLIYKTMNLDYVQTAGVNIVLPFNAGKWLESRLTLEGTYTHQHTDKFFDISLDRKKLHFMGNLDNSFTLNKNLFFELNARLQSPIIQGTLDIGTTASIDAGMKWTLAKGKMDLSAYCYDIFNTSAPKVTSNYKGQNLMMDNRFYTRSINVSLIYRFGGYKKKETKRVETSRFGH